MKEHAFIANEIMQSPYCLVKIAGDSDFTIFGYIVSEVLPESTVIHYIYIRPEFQRLGMGKALVASIGAPDSCEASHWVPVINDIASKYKSITYNPYRALINKRGE